MNKYIYNFLGIISLIFITITPGWAALGDQGAASVYKVTITKMEMSTDGTNYITVFTGTSTTIDIAAADAGSRAGDFVSGLTVPDGTYTHMKVTVSPTFIISGTDGNDFTTATNPSADTCTPGNAAQEAECTVTVTLGDPTPDVLPNPVTMKDGKASHKIRVNFDVSTAIEEYGAGNLGPATPTVTIETIAL